MTTRSAAVNSSLQAAAEVVAERGRPRKRPVAGAFKPTGNHPAENPRQPPDTLSIAQVAAIRQPRIAFFLPTSGLPECHRLVTGPTLTKSGFWGLLVALEMIRADASTGAGTSSPAPSR